MLIEAQRPQASAAMIAELAEHLRLPSGFPDEPAQAATLTRFLDVAIRVIEDRSRRALIRRSLRLRRPGWGAEGGLLFPIQPVIAVESLHVETADGARAEVAPELWRLDTLGGAAILTARLGRRLPPAPRDGFVEARFVAGFGDDWSDVPEDLRHAAVELAAAYFEQRAATAAATLPAGVAALLEPYRRVRL